MERRRIRTAIVAMVGYDNGVDHDAVMYMGGGDSHIVHRINRFSETHMTREYQFEVDFACCLWFAISFLTVLIPLVVPGGAMLAIIVILFSIPSDKTCPICHFCSRRQCMCAANHLALAKTDRSHIFLEEC